MGVKTLCALLALAACGPAPAGPPGSPPNSFADLWRASTSAQLVLEECVLAVALPNPEYPSDFQDVDRRIWSMQRRGQLPVFFTYSRDRNLFVLLNGQCARRAELSRRLEDYIHQNPRLHVYRVRPASPDEVRFMISTIDSQLLHGREPARRD
jgi:hypothetical protein